MTSLTQALYVGAFQTGDQVLSAWRQIFGGGHSVPVCEWTQQTSTVDDSVLLVSFGTGSTESERRGWVTLPLRKVLYVPRDGNDYAPYEIVQGCRHHNVVDAISGDPLDSKLYPRRLQEFQQRMERLCRNEPLYDRFDLGHGLLANKDSGFIATPFDSQDGFERGVEAALKGLDIAVNNPRREYNMKRRITEKIADMITESKIVLANMMYANGKGFNPNVFYEMGYGQAKEKTILPFRPRRDEPQAPIDIRDRDYIEYEDAIEVAMTLYWGLKDIVENGSSATTP